MTIKQDKTARPTARPVRKTWTQPSVAVLRAGDAKAGAEPVSPEGSFAFGS